MDAKRQKVEDGEEVAAVNEEEEEEEASEFEEGIDAEEDPDAYGEHMGRGRRMTKTASSKRRSLSCRVCRTIWRRSTTKRATRCLK